ncbi:MAG: aldo/keto reductase [Oscillospiraceae bacterium]|nr:aldo/keto reductase [Oscillospiraceae bacterium]
MVRANGRRSKTEPQQRNGKEKLVIGRKKFFQNTILKDMIANHSKTPAQTALRFLLQSGVVVLPKSTHKERMIENFNVFDFELNAEEMAILEALDTAQSLFFSHYAPETVEWFMSFAK